jgi:hypothetical protein
VSESAPRQDEPTFDKDIWDVGRVAASLVQLVEAQQIFLARKGGTTRLTNDRMAINTALLESMWLRARHLCSFAKQGKGDEIRLKDLVGHTVPNSPELKRLKAYAFQTSKQVAHLLRVPAGDLGFAVGSIGPDAVAVMAAATELLERHEHKTADQLRVGLESAQLTLQLPREFWSA